MSGDSGANQQQSQASSTLTDLPSWYKALTEKLGGQIGGQINTMTPINNQFLSGGTSPAGGVWTGGQTSAPNVPAQQPLNIPKVTLDGIAPAPQGPMGPGGFPLPQNGAPALSALNSGMGSGIGSAYTSNRGVLSAPNQGG